MTGIEAVTFDHKHLPAIRVLSGMAARAFVPLVLILLLVGVLAKGNFMNPVGVVILMTALGPIDVRRRHESVLWGNLGYGGWVFPVIYGGVALIGELCIALVTAAVR